MEIYPVQIKHAPQFSDIIESIAREDEFLQPSDTMSSLSAYRFVEQQLIDNAPMFVAMDGEQMVGWCEVSVSDLPLCRHNGLLSMGVTEAFRRQGVGTHLINKCLAVARSHGFERVELSVLDTNTVAQNFYKKNDFIVEGIKRRSLKKGKKYFNEILMARDVLIQAHVRLVQ